MISKWEKERNNLEDFINNNISYEEIGKKYNCSASNIRKIIKRFGIKHSKFNNKIEVNKNYPIFKCINCGKEFIKYPEHNGKYCSLQCQQQFQHKQKYQLILNGDPSIMRANYSPRNFKEDILEEQNNKCAICGISPEWNGSNLVFILDHIDGHASNNKRDNLRCICPNCDSQLDTYKFKNKNSDRFYRYRTIK